MLESYSRLKLWRLDCPMAPVPVAWSASVVAVMTLPLTCAELTVGPLSCSAVRG